MPELAQDLAQGEAVVGLVEAGEADGVEVVRVLKFEVGDGAFDELCGGGDVLALLYIIIVI